ncbi:uncharacterized protein N7482_009897 [Penicillium canariense]|uniref:NACHT domain-containing protein n=1 Tax=Penicillium canariense TaxID=189055 RepID=A0A9W9HU12_9EURO|nr:uncharacterized protein N7482_009897 [Penicillium canariense]KAJ5153419.1 hypothetical protein N7482_009897 [Penicillium canariense]
MSRALASASRLKPQIRLSQAIAEFQADLPIDQKIEFDKHTSRACNAPPSTNDVMHLTAEIDQQLSRKHRRCLGTRTTSFLQSVQQFAGLGDIIVGGSQNMIACGVWTLVRMSLLMILSFSYYFEKLSNIFMAIGRSAPRYEKLALLYPRSDSLRSCLYEYFIVAVHLCHHIVNFTKKSAFGKLGTTLNDPKLQDYQSQLESWAKEIKDEVNYLLAQRIEEQADAHTKILSAKFRKSSSHQRRMKEYLRALKFCSTYDHLTPWKQTRKAGRTSLFCQCPEFMQWKNRKSSGTLILTGPLGSGKSVLLANMVDYLNLSFQGKDSSVIFFFCRHDLPESLQRRVIVGSLTRQLLEQASGLPEKLGDWELPENGEWELMHRLLKMALPSTFKACLIIDGLDECSATVRTSVIEDLRHLQDSFSILICVSLRQKPRNPLTVDQEWKFLASIVIAAVPDNSTDIESFIEEELEARMESGRLTIGDPAIILEIEDRLLQGSQGMFLWVALQIDSLCAMDTDEAIRRALADLPPGPASYRRSIFEVIASAHHPLTLEELREALSVIPGDTTWNPSRLLNNIFDALTCCGSLLTLDEEGLTVRLVHSCVKQFLIDSQSPADWRFTIATAHRRMADIIITYLNYGVFETQLSKRPATPNLRVESTPTAIIQSTLGFSSTAKDIAVKLLKSRKKPGFDMGKVLAEMNVLPQNEPENQFSFLSYARTHCLFHVSLTAKEPQEKHLLLRLLHRNILDLEAEDTRQPILLWAAEHGQEEIFQLLRQHANWANLNTAGPDGRTPLHRAALFGNEVAVRHLLSHEALDANMCDENGWTPLNTAIRFAPEAVCKALIECEKVDTNKKDSSGQTPLHVAAGHTGTEKIVEMLLERKSTDPSKFDPEGRSSLYKAFENRNMGVVKAMLESRRVPPSPTGWGNARNALHDAARLGDATVTRLLLGFQEISPNKKAIDLITPLQEAIDHDAEEVAMILIDCEDTDVNVKGLDSQTPLHRAVGHGSETIALRLLETGRVNANIESSSGSTALHMAAAKGLIKVVKRMLELEGVDPNHTNKKGITPLHLAFKHNQHAVARILVNSPRVNPNIEDYYGKMPLEYSALRLSTPIMRLLFNSGEMWQIGANVDLNWTNDHGQNVLQRAIACKPKSETLDLLLQLSDVDASHTDQDGRTALHTAVIYGNGIEFLLDSERFDAVLDWRDCNGHTPQDLAETSGNPRIVRAISSDNAAARAHIRAHAKLNIQKTFCLLDL